MVGEIIEGNDSVLQCKAVYSVLTPPASAQLQELQYSPHEKVY